MFATDLPLVFTRKIDALGLRYMVTGSVAGVLYGEPRVTHDVDIVLVLRPIADIKPFAAAFPLEEFYCPPEEVILQEALRAQRGHFNLIHHESGFKADVYLVSRDPLHRWALGERRQVEVDGEAVWLAPPEYVIVRKLEFFREGGSEKHLRDIEAILRVSAELVRLPIIMDWVQQLGLGEQWARLQTDQ
jgi:hypothetical protein